MDVLSSIRYYSSVVILPEASMPQVTEKGQVTIPVEIRRKYGILPHTEVEFVDEDGKVFMRPKPRGKNRGQWIAKQLRGRLKGKTAWTTEELMAFTRGEDDGSHR
jgi:AbrB family looped-hinge helix DNA binding protein